MVLGPARIQCLTHRYRWFTIGTVSKRKVDKKRSPEPKQVKFRVRDEEWAQLVAEAKRLNMRSVPALARARTMEALA